MDVCLTCLLFQDILFRHGLHSFPRGYHKQKSKESDNAHIMTSQAIVEEVRCSYFESNDQPGNLFFRAVHAAKFIDRSNTNEDSGFQIASAKATLSQLVNILFS